MPSRSINFSTVIRRTCSARYRRAQTPTKQLRSTTVNVIGARTPTVTVARFRKKRTIDRARACARIFDTRLFRGDESRITFGNFFDEQRCVKTRRVRYIWDNRDLNKYASYATRNINNSLVTRSFWIYYLSVAREPARERYRFLNIYIRKGRELFVSTNERRRT